MAKNQLPSILRNAAIPIILVNIIFFILQMVLGRGFTEAFMLVGSEAFSRPWILITSMFLHGSPNHILFNMYALFLFGPLIEQRIGTKRFIIAYFSSGIIASIISSFFYEAALGASGAIMGILGITIMLMPHLRVLFFFIIPMSLRTAGIIFALIDIIGIFAPSGIANIAHLAGLTYGLGFGFYLLRKKKTFNRNLEEQSRKHAHHTRHRVHSTKNIEMSKEEIDEYLRNGRL
ncbi:rhomboid family intramembrane serine protease [Nanoarchaeota archaeon]